MQFSELPSITKAEGLTVHNSFRTKNTKHILWGLVVCSLNTIQGQQETISQPADGDWKSIFQHLFNRFLLFSALSHLDIL